MRLLSFVLTFWLLHSVGSVSARWETGLDGDLYGEIPRPTSEPLLYRREFEHRAILMETRPGRQRNGTSRRNLGLDQRQLSCNPGYVLSCPSRPKPCCPVEHPLCCSDASNVCCSVGSFCVGVNTCCYDGQVGCGLEEGCCPAGTRCCGIWCCTGTSECRNGDCVNVALSSLSVASVLSVQAKSSRSRASVQSRSLESAASVASVRSKSIESEASVAAISDSTTTTAATTGNSNINSNSNSNGNVALVGGAVGGALGATLLGLIGVLLWRRKRGTPDPPPASQRPFFGQQPSSQPITPASPTFSTNTGYLGGPPVTQSAQYGWGFQQSLSSVPPAVGQTSTASHQSASPPPAVNTWIERPRTIHQENYGGSTPQLNPPPSSPSDGPVDPRQLYSDALQMSTHSAVAPVNVPSSSYGASGNPSPPPAAYSFVSPTGKF